MSLRIKQLIATLSLLIFAVPSPVFAARIWTTGFELNSATAGIEADFVGTGDWTTSTTTRTGTYAGAVTGHSGVAAYYQHQITATTPGANGPYYMRAYVQVPSLPNTETDFMWLQQDSGSFLHSAAITMDSSGVLRLYNYSAVGVAAQVAAGGPNSNGTSNALSTGTWYRVELKYDRTAAGGSQILEGEVDGVVFATASNLTIGNAAGTFAVGENGAAQTATSIFLFDDVAVNDGTGASQTTYPGAGSVIRITPNAAGDVNTWNGTNTGGTAGTGNNFTRVFEITPDDATTLNGSFTLNQEDLFKNNASGIGSSDTVNVVEIHGRTRDATADTAVALKLEVEKAPAGTVAQSTAIVPNATTWITDARAVPHIAPIVEYKDPDGTNAWTQATLDTMQIGYKETAAPATGSRQINITDVWALVDYTPATVIIQNADLACYVVNTGITEILSGIVTVI